MPRPLVGHYTHVINDIRAFDFMLLHEEQQEQDDDHEEADRDEQDHEQDEQVSLILNTTTMI